jgi:hypothetical protein
MFRFSSMVTNKSRLGAISLFRFVGKLPKAFCDLSTTRGRISHFLALHKCVRHCAGRESCSRLASSSPALFWCVCGRKGEGNFTRPLQNQYLITSMVCQLGLRYEVNCLSKRQKKIYSEGHQIRMMRKRQRQEQNLLRNLKMDCSII